MDRQPHTLNQALTRTIHLIRQFATLRADSLMLGLFSGGKDSVVLKHIITTLGLPIKWRYNVTTIDPPELVEFIREQHPDVQWQRPKQPFFKAALVKGFPTRTARWCCEVYKRQTNPPGARLIMGIRAEESAMRKRDWTEIQYLQDADNLVLLPIYQWTVEHVWQYIRLHRIPYCKLYDEGFTRLGCIGCPYAGTAGRNKQFARWPGYHAAWLRLFRRLWETRANTTQRDGLPWFGRRKFSSWQEMWDWWHNDQPTPPDRCTGPIDLT